MTQKALACLGSSGSLNEFRTKMFSLTTATISASWPEQLGCLRLLHRHMLRNEKEER